MPANFHPRGAPEAGPWRLGLRPWLDGRPGATRRWRSMQVRRDSRGVRAGVWVAAALVAAIASCGGPDEDVVITISPATAVVAAGQTVQFMATVTGSHNTKVNWGAA